jgi:H+/Cl- antiporter ClcA
MLLESPGSGVGELSLQGVIDNFNDMNLPDRIRILGKKTFDRIRNEKLKHNLLQAIPFWIASLLTGLVAVVYTRLFRWAELQTAAIVHWHFWLLFIVTPVCFLVAWWLVRRFSPFSRGSGIPQVMASIELATPKYNDRVGQLLSLRVVIIKILSSLVMAVGGGVIGREGPTIQVAGSIFRKVNEWLPRWWPKVSKRNMIMTGAAAGLAAAFNTPLGGIVFAVEELTRTHISYFKTALFTAVIIAGLTGIPI